MAGRVRFGWSIAWLAGSAVGGRIMATPHEAPYFLAAVLYGAGAIATFLLLRGVRPEDEIAADTERSSARRVLE